MGTVALVIFIFIIPFTGLLWASLSGTIGKLLWKISLAIFVVLVIGSFIANYYLSKAYELSFFQNGFESTVALVIAAAILLVLLVVNMIVSRLFKGAPKSVHNPKAVWVIAAVFCSTMLFFTMWVYPLGEKASYILKIESALAAAEEQQDGEEITIVLMSSEKECFRTRNTSSNCNSAKYQNSFFLKNNLDVQKQVQVQIRALDSKQQELKVIESDVMTLEAGELKLIETEESSDQSSIWSRSSFETEYRTQSYEYKYRYRDAN